MICIFYRRYYKIRIRYLKEGTAMTVSYTHLDVYKRQQKGSPALPSPLVFMM